MHVIWPSGVTISTTTPEYIPALYPGDYVSVYATCDKLPSDSAAAIAMLTALSPEGRRVQFEAQLSQPLAQQLPRYCAALDATINNNNNDDNNNARDYPINGCLCVLLW